MKDSYNEEEDCCDTISWAIKPEWMSKYDVDDK